MLVRLSVISEALDEEERAENAVRKEEDEKKVPIALNSLSRSSNVSNR